MRLREDERDHQHGEDGDETTHGASKSDPAGGSYAPGGAMVQTPSASTRRAVIDGWKR